MRQVRADGRCYDLSGATKDKRVFTTQFDADEFLSLHPSFKQESYLCEESGTLHYHLRDIDKSRARTAVIESIKAESNGSSFVKHAPTVSAEDLRSTRHERLRKLVAANGSITDMAIALGVSKATVRKDMYKLDLEFPKHEGPSRHEQVESLHTAGGSVKEMALQLGVSQATIRKDLKYLSLTPNKKVRGTGTRRARGATLQEINAKLNLIMEFLGMTPKVMAAKV